jgi:PAS domain S-box-containing protein
MSIKDIGGLIAIFGSLIGGIWWAWKNMIKPVLAFIKSMEEMQIDIKELQKLPDRIEYVKGKTNGVIYLSDVPMFVCNEEGLCILANKAICDLFGAEEKQMRGYGWLNFLHPEDRALAQRHWELAIHSGNEDVTGEYRIINGDSVVDAVYHSIIIRGNEGQLIVSVGKVKQK